MYTFAYDYLKDNPQLRADAVTKHWVTLSKDAACSSAVRNELLQMTKNEIVIDDCSLFWHKHYQELLIITENEKKVKKPESWSAFNSKLALYLYSIYQQELSFFDTERAYDLLCVLPCDMTDNEIITMEVAQRLMTNVVNCDSNRFNVMLISSLLYGLASYTVYNADEKEAKLILNSCTVDLIKSIRSRSEFLELVQLINDTDFKVGDKKFKSRNEIETAHDIRTERITAELIKECKGEKYKYTPELLKLVSEYGFFMPGSPEALVIRGKQHSNCVGTYSSRHCETVFKNIHFYTVTRLLFTRDTTIELRFEIAHDTIVATQCIQCKGRYNKDAERTEKLTALRIALTGKPKEIIHVEVQYD